MGTLVAGARQVLRWTVRTAACSLRRPELLCPSARRAPLQSTQRSYNLDHAPEKPVTEPSLQSLVDMGFTCTQAEQIYESLSKVRRGGAAKNATSTLTALIVLGFNPASVLKVTETCPQLYTVREAQLQQRIDNLRKLGLVEGSLQRMVAHYPQILTVTLKTVKKVVAFLREKCLFTSQQVTNILRDSPAIVLEDLGQLEYKFQYVYFRMGIKQAEMVKSKIFRCTLDEIRCRHCFLERRGLYQTPDKKGQTVIINPKLDSILNVDQDTFLTAVAKASAEEYEIFQRLMAREWQGQEKEYGNVETDIDDYTEEEENEEDETGGKAAYRKRKKK